MRHLSRHLLVGALTAAPLLVTWFVFDLLLGWLSRLGAPGLAALAATLRPASPDLARWLLEGWLTSLVAALLALTLLAALGWFASRVIGRRILDALESLVQRIPLVAAIYGGTKRFLTVVKDRPAETQRVVLIPFPNRRMKTIGFVTKVLEDESEHMMVRHEVREPQGRACSLPLRLPPLAPRDRLALRRRGMRTHRVDDSRQHLRCHHQRRRRRLPERWWGHRRHQAPKRHRHRR